MMIERALDALRNGKMVVLVDDEDRENEGDLILAAEFASPETINFMAQHARGLICLALEGRKVDELGLSMMAARNESKYHSPFTVSIEARQGITTGISCSDRAHTIKVASDPKSGPLDVVSPGHIFPLRAQDGGVLVRAGHTEGGVDLARLAGLRPAAVLCEIMNPDGSMARLPDLQLFAAHHDMPIITIKDLIEYRSARDSLVECVAKTKLPVSIEGHSYEFELFAFRDLIEGTEHLALVSKGDQTQLSNPALVRVHSECLTGDVFGSQRCDCGEQLHESLKQIHSSGNGVLVYIRRHEGRGIGLANKIKAYALQDGGLDTVEANRHLGFKADLRHYGVGAQILKYLGISELKLLTNNPKKIVGLEGYGLSIVDRTPIIISAGEHNSAYLKTKGEKLGHILN